MNVRPTKTELWQERVFMLTLLADTAILVVFFLVAEASGSLTILGETIRAGIVLSLHFHAFWTLRGVHRGRFQHYEFGVGKIEYLVWTLLGLAVLVGAYWIGMRLIETLSGDADVASPMGLAGAAIANAAGLLVNYAGLKAMEQLADEDTSGVLRAQISARLGMLLLSVSLMPTMTAAAVSRDASIAYAFDAIGALFLIYLKLLRAIVMLREGVPGLLDSPASPEFKRQVMEIVRTIVPGRGFSGIRTRRCGSVTEVELLLSPDAAPSSVDLAEMRDTIAAQLSERGLLVRLSLVIASLSNPNVNPLTTKADSNQRPALPKAAYDEAPG
jgi:divalent metal cation (Fe/Co/Zn/Cd) transporter